MLDLFFSFLARRTDFYIGTQEGQAEALVQKSFRKFQSVAEERLRKEQEERAEANRKQQERLKREREKQEAELRAVAEEQKRLEEQKRQSAEPVRGNETSTDY